MSRNLVILIGNVGADPKATETPNSTVCNFPVATNSSYKDKHSGEKITQTEWHNVTCWNNVASWVGSNVNKGDSVYVEGSIHTRKYMDKDQIERYATEIKAKSVQKLNRKTKSETQGEEVNGNTNYELNTNANFTTDDIPF